MNKDCILVPLTDDQGNPHAIFTIIRSRIVELVYRLGPGDLVVTLEKIDQQGQSQYLPQKVYKITKDKITGQEHYEPTGSLSSQVMYSERNEYVQLAFKEPSEIEGIWNWFWELGDQTEVRGPLKYHELLQTKVAFDERMKKAAEEAAARAEKARQEEQKQQGGGLVGADGSAISSENYQEPVSTSKEEPEQKLSDLNVELDTDPQQIPDPYVAPDAQEPQVPAE